MAFNSNEFEYADTKVSILGVELSGLRGLTYKKTQEKELVYGQGRKPKAVQRGEVKFEGQLMLLKGDFDELNAAAIAAGYTDIVDVPGRFINIVCVYQKEGNPAFKSDSLINVEFTEFEDGLKFGDKFKEVTLPFICLDVIKA